MASKLTKAQLVTELARVTQERDDALIALDAARRTIADYQERLAPPLRADRHLPPRLVELRREPTRQGDLLRAGETLYQATITERDDGKGFHVVAPIPHAKPLMTSLSPDGVGYLPEHAVLKLVKA